MIHLICLVGWLLSSEGLGPAICTLLADMDAVHEVVVAAEANGSALVTLKHENDEELMEPHGLLVTALLILGRASEDPSKDHVLSFLPLDDGRRIDPRKILPPPPLRLNWRLPTMVQALSTQVAFHYQPLCACTAKGRVMRC